VEVIAPVERTLTELDHVRLLRLVAQAGAPLPPGAEAIQDLLDNSDVVAPRAVPPTVLTMYTQLLLQDPAGGPAQKLTLCYPADADPAQGFVSVLSPVGAALIGLRVGEMARWNTPAGVPATARIVSILFQPEASGDYTT
jgi:regulator of nucleoside diphosphate kinase